MYVSIFIYLYVSLSFLFLSLSIYIYIHVYRVTPKYIYIYLSAYLFSYPYYRVTPRPLGWPTTSGTHSPTSRTLSHALGQVGIEDEIPVTVAVQG